MEALRRSVIYLGSQPVGGKGGLWAFKPMYYYLSDAQDR